MRFRFTILAGLALAAGLLVHPILSDAAEGQGDFSAQQKAAIETIVHDYLMAHPEILKDMSQAMQAREMADMLEKASKGIVENKDALNAKDLPFIGAKNGDVTIYQFFDYQCHYCKMVLKTVETLVEEDSKIKIVLVDYPILSEASHTVAKAALAANKQGKYGDFYNVMMGYQGRLDQATIEKLAGSVGIDVEKMKADMESEAVQSRLNKNIELAQAIGIRGTPGFVVADKLVPGAMPLAQFRKLVADIRAGKAGK